MKARLLVTSALLMFVEISPPQAQETADIAKITCEHFLMQSLEAPSHDVWVWIDGYYNGKRNNTIVELQTIKSDEDKLRTYCLLHGDTTVMDAVKNMGLGK